MPRFLRDHNSLPRTTNRQPPARQLDHGALPRLNRTAGRAPHPGCGEAV